MMFKVQKLVLIIILTSFVDMVYAGDFLKKCSSIRVAGSISCGGNISCGPSIRTLNKPELFGEKLYLELIDAIEEGLVNNVKSLIEQSVDINQKESGPIGHTPLTLAIERAGYSLGQGFSDAEIRLSIIELLIHAGASINAEGQFGLMPLEQALSPILPKLPIIKLLLGYGATITEKAVGLAKLKSNNEIMRILNLHQRLLKQVQSNPTKELLRVTIAYNKPYFVQLIVDNKPELVTLSDIELAKETSPASIPILTKAFKLRKLRELAAKKDVPAELVHRIEKLIERNK